MYTLCFTFSLILIISFWPSCLIHLLISLSSLPLFASHHSHSLSLISSTTSPTPTALRCFPILDSPTPPHIHPFLPLLFPNLSSSFTLTSPYFPSYSLLQILHTRLNSLYSLLPHSLGSRSLLYLDSPPQLSIHLYLTSFHS